MDSADLVLMVLCLILFRTGLGDSATAKLISVSVVSDKIGA